MKLSNKDVELDVIILDNQDTQPSNAKPGYTSIYTT